MRPPRRGRSVPAMLGRVLFRLAVVAGLLLLISGPLRAAVGGDGAGAPAGRIPPPPTQGLPPQMAAIMADVQGVQERSLAGRLGRLGRGGGTGDGRPGAAVGGAARPFADRGAPRQLARLRRDVARALRAASTSDDRVSVAAWQGVYVSGRRAVALADLRRAVRSRRGMPFRRLPLVRTRLELVRQGRRWAVLDVAGALPYK